MLDLRKQFYIHFESDISITLRLKHIQYNFHNNFFDLQGNSYRRVDIFIREEPRAKANDIVWNDRKSLKIEIVLLEGAMSQMLNSSVLPIYKILIGALAGVWLQNKWANSLLVDLNKVLISNCERVRIDYGKAIKLEKGVVAWRVCEIFQEKAIYYVSCSEKGSLSLIPFFEGVQEPSIFFGYFERFINDEGIVEISDFQGEISFRVNRNINKSELDIRPKERAEEQLLAILNSLSKGDLKKLAKELVKS